MTTFQDQPPQSRRALRQEERGERRPSEEIDEATEALRGAPSGRRARAAQPDGLVEVATEPAETSPAETAQAETAQAETAVEQAAAPAEQAPVVTDSAIAKPFPFAEQVEATSDDAGHPGFRLRDFSPELSTSRAETQSAADWAPAGDESVPLDYQTQGRPAFGYVSPYSEPSTPPVAEPAQEPSFDSLFSDLLVPDDTEQSESAADEPVADETAANDSVADEPAVPLGEPVIVAEPIALVAPVEVAPEERTLSRREWRAMRAKAEAEAEANAAAVPLVEPTAERPAVLDEVSAVEEPVAVEPVAVEPLFIEQPSAPDQSVETAADPDPMDILFQQPTAVEPEVIPPLVEPAVARQSALSDAMAEFEALTRGGQESPTHVEAVFQPPVLEQPVEPQAVEPKAVEPQPVAPAPVQFEQTPPAQPEQATPEQVTPEQVTPEQAAPEQAQAPEKTPFSFLISPSAPGAVSTDTGGYVPPVGHWSRQAELDDENQPFENTLSRDVGGGNVATTTNALVLPLIPQRDDFSSVLNATGEIMVTGTINLPGSVGSTGRDSRHYDDPEVDHLFDAFDTEIANTDSAPVRAITAVSSHTATRGGIESGRKQSNRMLNVLLVTAVVMAVAVAGLLLAGFVFNIF